MSMQLTGLKYQCKSPRLVFNPFSNKDRKHELFIIFALTTRNVKLLHVYQCEACHSFNFPITMKNF